MWFEQRDLELKEKFTRVKNKETLSIGQPFAPIDGLYDDSRLQFVNYNYILENPSAELDILFFQGYAPETEKMIEVLKSGRVGIIATWFWDNHHLYVETTRNSFLSDINFYAHYYDSHYVHGHLHNWGGFVPLAPIAWSESEIINFREKYFKISRDSRLYGGYNAYDKWPEREIWLESIVNSNIPSNIKIYKHGISSHPYYTLSREEKFEEWAKNKVCLCSSFDKNTTIRMFDALVTGSVVVLTGKIADLGMIFPADLKSIGVIHVENPNIENIKKAHEEAIDMFDSTGESGMIERSNFILKNHMPFNRVKSMVDSILKK